MTEALHWAYTQEGVSDIWRFWGNSPDKFNIDELVAFLNTLPDESATKKKVFKHKASLDVMVFAMVFDAIRELHMALAKKKLKDKDRLFTMLSEQKIESKEDLDDFMKQAKKTLKS